MRPLRSRPASPHRAGITLTEILIAILIMGVGLVSIATLFPLGLIRMQRAMRDSRSTLLARSAIAEVRDRDLLNGRSFGMVGWYNSTAGLPVIDPWLSESTTQGADGLVSLGYLAAPGATYTANQLRPGLPVCYDPLWWAIVHQNSASGGTNPWTLGLESRFGNGSAFSNGASFLRPDPNGGVPSAHGLQRVTNFRDWPRAGVDNTPFYQATPYPFVYGLTGSNDIASQVFGSPDNIIFNGEDQEVPNRGNSNAPSSLLPDLTTMPGSLMFDLKYTWFFTGQRPNVQEAGSYVGSIVVCENRVMGLETITAPNGSPATVPQGERIYEAIWGYSGRLVKPLVAAPAVGYGVGERTVLIRWNAIQPDPVLKSGSYLADVTYERTQALSLSRFGLYGDTPQRCEWYRVAGATTPEIDPEVGNHRRMIVTLETPVRAKTLLNVSNGQAYHSNAVLVMPSVINVIPQAFVTSDGK